MKRQIALTSTLALLAQPLAAQTATTTDGFDFDTLAACSIVYQRISELYIEQGDTGQGRTFQETAHAYSSGAFQMLLDQNSDTLQAYTYSEGRMQIVMESLNESSRGSQDGDMGVITEWLPYCDTLGAGISQLLKVRESQGW